MQRIIDKAVKDLIEIINNKESPKDVAWQFILEELEAARNSPVDFVHQRISTFYIEHHEYKDAMKRSWSDVDGPGGPQQYLVNICLALLSQKINSEVIASLRISIVEYILAHYKFGRYFTNDLTDKNSCYIDLFFPEINGIEKNPNFVALLDDKYCAVRKVINKWAIGFIDRDNKFKKEFQSTFNSTFWELYLFQAFRDFGMQIDFSEQSPDFTVKTITGRTLNIEAVTANKADNTEPEWSSKRNLKNRSNFLNFSCIRILNSLNSKHKRYLNYYSSLSHVEGNPYIIALAPFEQPNFFIQNNEAIIRVLYGQGVRRTRNQFGELVCEVEFTPTISKENGAILELGIFTNQKYKEISAIIFSTTATVSKAIVQSNMEGTVRVSRFDSKQGLRTDLVPNDKHVETHLDGLQIYHNPFAENPLNPEDFSKYEVSHYFYDLDKKVIDNRQRNYTIVSRIFFND
ncbi:hypothetical protein IC800_10045 [Acinetobacter seifertii]|uniref:hypothetical protein n=1 Tax=Acinetobacter TaxID=469 RepID=UPI00168D390E|nr:MULTISPECIES: hypothetical protein [Acinetobacter]MDS7945056.1 hypothetical protein [Acinetobacter sp. V110_1]QNW93426.1 hypothetical protein IC800_10045 [Acinetobacter seifertii]QNX00513.1 hypothetical protein IC798_10470 [Acinetobacter seifertii]